MFFQYLQLGLPNLTSLSDAQAIPVLNIDTFTDLLPSSPLYVNMQESVIQITNNVRYITLTYTGNGTEVQPS